VTSRRLFSLVALAAVSLVAVAVPASAHVTVSPDEAPAGGYGVVELSVPHGCEDAPTNELAVQLDPGIRSVKAQAVPGWTASYTMADLDEPYELHGTEITEYVAEITWTAAGDPLAPDQYMTFGISAQWPDTVGETVLLPAVQRCTDGSETAWIDEDPDAELPAPAVSIVEAAEGGHGEEVADEEAAGDASDDDSSSDTLAIVAIVVAVLALAVAGASFAATRRK
jgi:uncharacterized protein YcnI